MRYKIIKNIFLIFLLLSALIFISGQEGCNTPPSSRSGVGFSLISRQDTLQQGKIIQLGETFYVGIKVDNYDKKDRQVEVCIQDTVSDQYGGIVQKECQQVFLPAAESVKKSSSSILGSSETEEITPGTKEIFFPEEGQYSYQGLPRLNSPFNPNIIVTLKYPETSQATTAVYVPTLEQPSLSQEPSQIMVSLAKSIYSQGDAYKVNLDLTFYKNPEARIFLQDYSEENENKTYLNVKLSSQAMDCKTTNSQPIGNVLEIKDTKTIRCSSLIYQGAYRQDYDLVITMVYGVMLEDNFAFSIDTRQEA